jgi:hypothetical protein
MDKWTIKTPNSICRLFFKINLLTDLAALCLTDFIDWRCIHALLVFSTQLVNCWTKELYLCTVAPLPSLWPPPTPLTKLNVQYVAVGGGGVSSFVVDHILQEFYTLFLTRFRTNKIASPPQTKITSKDDIKGFVSLKFLRPWAVQYQYLHNLYWTVHFWYRSAFTE